LYIKNYRILILIFLIFFLTGCRRPALNRKKTGIISQNSSTVHTVKKGDTLYSISRLYNISIQNIMDSNNIPNPNVLSIGQNILIKDNKISKVTKPVQKKESKPVSSNQVKQPVSRPRVVENSTAKSNEKIFIKPVNGNVQVLFNFGDMKNGIRVDGIEYKIVEKTEILSASSGDVVYVDSEGRNKIIIIEHKNNFYTVYSNLSSVNVKMGDVVKEAHLIGSINKNSDFYFELRKFVSGSNPQALNPVNFFKN
jgi:lipoprotein NlpD